jgi:hypothetical protein
MVLSANLISAGTLYSSVGKSYDGIFFLIYIFYIFAFGLPLIISKVCIELFLCLMTYILTLYSLFFSRLIGVDGEIEDGLGIMVFSLNDLS